MNTSSAEMELKQDHCADHEVQTEVKVAKIVEQVPQHDWRGRKTQNAVDETELTEQQDDARHINQEQQSTSLVKNPRVAQRKFKAEVQEQGRQKQACAEIRPKDRPIECIELAGRVERVKHKRRQANEIEVQCMRRSRTFEQYEDPNEQIEQPDDFEVLLMSKGLFGSL